MERKIYIPIALTLEYTAYDDEAKYENEPKTRESVVRDLVKDSNIEGYKIINPRLIPQASEPFFVPMEQKSIQEIAANLAAHMNKLLQMQDLVRLCFAHFLRYPSRRMPLPYETVVHPNYVRDAEHCADVARAFSTGCYQVGHGVIDGDSLRTAKDFKGFDQLSEILIAEYWADYGSDGHTEFVLQGWVPIPASAWVWPGHRNHLGQFPDTNPDDPRECR